MKPAMLPLDGLRALTDETGMFQHTKYSTIDRREGYTTDDNARALIAALRHFELYREQEALQMANVYLSFTLYMQKNGGCFHNLLGFDRRFKDDVGSEDCAGRAIWASGYTLSTDIHRDMKLAAKEIFDRGLRAAHSFTSPRAWAFTILGLCHYHEAFPDDSHTFDCIDKFSRWLMDLYSLESADDWRWFEPYLTYSNPRLPQALFNAHELTGDPSILDIAKSTFDFLIDAQLVEGVFVPIGNRGWMKRGGERAIYDQQPIEASSMVEAALAAHGSTGDSRYREVALIAFEWYHGKNTNEVVLFNPETSTCYDGIMPEGLNLNQGAEATISYYLAYLKLREMSLL